LTRNWPLLSSVALLVLFLRCLCSCDYSRRHSKQRGHVATVSDRFREFFQAATNRTPHDYQRRLATEVYADGPKSLAINVPTGAGKTVSPSSRRS
jgi:reverse gyrase